MNNGTISEVWEIYGEVFCLHSHQLLAWAYADVRPRLKADMEEPDITGLLAGAMKLRLNHPDTPDVFDHYWPGDQEPHSPSGELGNDRLRFDITIIRNGLKPRISFIFEAKRLRTGGFPIGKYVGDGGMGDFIECRYGAEHPEAAMVALFQNKDGAYWHDELKRVFTEEQVTETPRLAIHEPLCNVHIMDDFPDELQSIHRRSNRTNIRIYHIFLDCS
ncbi:MAG TPA: hypothetical protein VGO67_18650 [Verrucomicrobiae bacterium]|jgi:hypothetical protein